MLIYAFFDFYSKKIRLIGGFPDPTHKGHLAALLDDQLKKIIKHIVLPTYTTPPH